MANADVIVTREQMIERINAAIMECAEPLELLEDAVLFGRTGLMEMSDEELAEAFTLWCEEE